MASPTRAELAAARDRLLPDVIGPGLRVLFSGINPGLWSAAVGYHFARPGNRFWPALHRSGFTPRQLSPAEQVELLGYRLGVTNLVPRATARADELPPAELVEGAAALRAKIGEYQPDWLAVVGLSAYRTAFGARDAGVGPQALAWGTTRIWVLPNPSGLNASYQIDRLVAEFARLRAAAFEAPQGDTAV